MKVIKGKVVLEEGEELGNLTLPQELRTKLMEDNTYYVWYVIGKHFKYPTTLEKEDLYGYGLLGLCAAANKYDINTGFSFTSYAHKTIWGEIKRGIRDHSGLLGTREQRQSNQGNLPTPFSYYENCGTSDHNSGDVFDIFYQPDTGDTSYDEVLDRINIEKVLSFAEPRDKEMFYLYYRDNLSQTTISKSYGISQVQVSRRLKKVQDLFKFFEKVL